MELSGTEAQDHFCFLAALFLRLILFLRHFQRMLPFFFHARELRFIQFPLNCLRDGADPGGFEPPTSGLEGRRHIQTRPRVHFVPVPAPPGLLGCGETRAAHPVNAL